MANRRGSQQRPHRRRAVADPFTRQLVLRQARREADMFKRRYQHLAEYAEIVASLNQEAAS